MFCAQQVAEFRPHYPELKQQGVEVYVIGSGGPHFAKAFVENEKPEMPIFSDESRASFDAAGLKRSFFGILDPRMIAKGCVTAFKFRQRRTMGDAFQLGGILLVKPDGSVPYHYASKYAGDHPPVEKVVAEARGAA